MDGVFKRKEYTEDEIKSKREVAERRARRGEMDVMQEHTFATLAMVDRFIKPDILTPLS